MERLRIVFFGTPEFVIPVVKSIHTHFDLVGVVTTPDTIQGRKKVLTPTPVKEFVTDSYQNLPILTPESLTDDTVQHLQKLSPDFFVVAAYGKIIPQAILDIPKFGSVNIHPSLLPHYRGPSPIQTTLLHGDTVSGVSLILMDKEVDHGPLLAQETMELKPTDTFATLHVSMFKKAADMLPEVLRKVAEGSLSPQEQDHENATFCSHITKESGYFDLKSPPIPEELDRMIRAYYPWPTAWTRFTTKKGDKKILKFLPENNVQPEGKNPMPIKDFLNGNPEMRETIKTLLGR